MKDSSYCTAQQGLRVARIWLGIVLLLSFAMVACAEEYSYADAYL